VANRVAGLAEWRKIEMDDDVTISLADRLALEDPPTGTIRHQRPGHRRNRFRATLALIDTSALLAALVQDHEHHAIARRALTPTIRVPVIVIAETFSQLRRTFGQSARTAAQLLQPWSRPEHILSNTASATAANLARAVELDLGGNIHDAVIAQICAEAGLPFVTLDGRQHRIALALRVNSTYLIA
jgi:predicted nucleic acid-binding protein